MLLIRLIPFSSYNNNNVINNTQILVVIFDKNA